MFDSSDGITLPSVSSKQPCPPIVWAYPREMVASYIGENGCMDRGEATWVSAEDMPEAGWEYLRSGRLSAHPGGIGGYVQHGFAVYLQGCGPVNIRP